MRSRAEVERVRQLAATGMPKTVIARTLGIPRSTVRQWLRGRYPGWQADLGLGVRRATCFVCEEEAIPERAYSYLLGQYLGDGSITTSRKGVHRLIISTDAKYAGIIQECVRALGTIFPSSVVGVQRAGKAECFNVMIHSKHVTCLFPQHGPGRKHEREIVLASWQRRIVEREPEALIRGLIHSDGCRAMNRVRRPLAGGAVGTYAYPRYFFSNASSDIQRIFTDTLDALGIAWRKNRWNSISVARAPDVARLDAFVGPKA